MENEMELETFLDGLFSSRNPRSYPSLDRSIMSQSINTRAVEEGTE
jgi:hypothetical protein